MPSTDLEDIISVVDGCPTVVKEITASPAEVRHYIGNEISQFLANSEFLDALLGHVTGDAVSQARIPMILEALHALCALR
jgi:hypothetical protein